MSKTLSQFRMAFVGLIALLQLILLPATHVLHLGCQHSHDDAHTFNASSEAADRSCVSSHCCGHCSQRTAATDADPAGSAPVHPPHDEDSCPVCQIVFAARIATAAPVDLTTVEPVCEFLSADSPIIYSTPRYSVLSRGPPTASWG